MLRKKRTYLDLAAGVSGNPSSPHEEGRKSRELLEGARVTIARLLECKADDIIFTSGATEGNALAILGVIRGARAAGIGEPHALYCPGAHASIVENMKLAEREGAIIEPIPIVNCKVDTDVLAGLLRPETVLVSMEAVDGETGVVWDTREISRVLEKSRSDVRSSGSLGHGPQSLRKAHIATGPYLHVDASQAVWSEKLTRDHFGADLMTLDASKVSPVRGIGCLIAARSIPLVPLYGGGGQERGLRPGSESPLLASAFAKALASVSEGREAFRASSTRARHALVEILKAGIPDILVNESADAQVPGILNVSLPGRDTDYLVALLDEFGFAVSTKSACETDSGEGSRAVLALYDDPARAAVTLRVSWDSSIRGEDLERFGQALIHAVRFIDTAGGA